MNNNSSLKCLQHHPGNAFPLQRFDNWLGHSFIESTTNVTLPASIVNINYDNTINNTITNTIQFITNILYNNIIPFNLSQYIQFMVQ